MERLPFTAAGRGPLVRFRSPLKFTGRLLIVQSPLARRDGFIQARRLRLPTSGSFRNWPTLGHVVGGLAAICHGSICVAFASSSSESPARRLTSRLRRPTFNRRAGPSPSGLMDSRRDGCGSIRQGTASRGPSSQPTWSPRSGNGTHSIVKGVAIRTILPMQARGKRPIGLRFDGIPAHATRA
jgi:hypothetical protein